MEFFQKFVQQFRQMWDGMSTARRVGLASACLVCVGLVGGVWYWAALPDYRVLYSGLTVEDAGAITSKLQAAGVSYQLAAGGTTVLVSAEQVQQRRLELAVDGLPAKGGRGFELFDQSPLGMTPFTQHVNYLRALQAELAKTIMQIDPVVFARVHIVRPDPSPFVREQKPTTGSVVLKLRPGATLGRQVAGGIVSLVARSVEGLAQENVTLLDTSGRLLSDPPSAEGGAIASQMEYRRELESHLASKAEGMLAQVLGPGRAIVRVTADLNFQRMRQQKETYSPEGKVIRSERITTTKSNSAAASSRGPAGAASNLGKQGPTSAPSGSNSSEESVQTDFAISKVVQEFEDKIGNIERLTVAAMVDLSAAAESSPGAGPAFTLTDAQEIIKQAVGYKVNRDEIKVSNVKLTGPTPDPAADEAWEKMQQWQTVLSLVRSSSLALAALVTFFLGYLVLRRLKPAAPAAPPEAPPQPEQVVAQRLRLVAEEEPERLALVLENWLNQVDRQRRAAG